MRFWDEPPRPGSLEEDLALLVQDVDDYRAHRYAQLLATAAMTNTEEGAKSVIKAFKAIEEARFGEQGVEHVDEKEAVEFLKMMENHQIRIKTHLLPQHLPPDQQPLQEQDKGKKFIYAERRGERL